MAGYSKKSLLEKLGVTTNGKPLVVTFVASRSILLKQFPSFARSIYPDGTLWIAWPKTTSGVATDLTETVVRDIGLKHGVVDVKVAALDDVWSGLKFVVRLKNRK